MSHKNILYGLSLVTQQKKKEVHMGTGEDGHTVGLGAGARPSRTGDRGWPPVPTAGEKRERSRRQDSQGILDTGQRQAMDSARGGPDLWLQAAAQARSAFSDPPKAVLKILSLVLSQLSQ